MISTSLYEKAFKIALTEDMSAGAGGVFGELQDTNQDDLGKPTDDTYAKGDARLPKILGGVQRRSGGSPKKTKKIKKKQKSQLPFEKK